MRQIPKQKYLTKVLTKLGNEIIKTLDYAAYDHSWSSTTYITEFELKSSYVTAFLLFESRTFGIPINLISFNEEVNV